MVRPGESADARFGLAVALWWLGENHDCVAQCERAHRLFRQSGDAASINDALGNAAAVGADVRLVESDAAIAHGGADLVCVFEALHDMAQPVAVLAEARSQLASNGAVLLVDERVEDAFTAPAGEVERMMYGWSVLHCLPASRAETPSAALGTVLRRPVVEQLAAEAGFKRVDVLGIENDFFRFYRLRT